MNAQAFHLKAKIADNIKGVVYRLVTLTLKTQGPWLRADLDHLYRSFRRLKQRAFWRHHVTGGVVFCEVKWNPEKHRWHPHLHCLVHGKFLPHNDLSKQWHAATGDSFIVDVRAVKNANQAADYVAKYVTKGYGPSVFETRETLLECIRAMKGRRLVLKLGDWEGFDLQAEPSDEGWEVVERLGVLLDRVRDGDVEAHLILAHLRAELTEIDADMLRTPARSPPPATSSPPQGSLFPGHAIATQW